MNIAAFVNWAKEKGVETRVAVEETPYAGYGLFAMETIENDSPTVVVHIPNNMLLSSSKALQVDSTFSQEIYKFLSKKYNTTKNLESLAQESRNERLVLCFFLIYCKFFKPTSIWKPYIDVLPTVEFCKQNHILFNAEYVTGTSLEMLIRAKLSSLKRELDEISYMKRKEAEDTVDQGGEDEYGSKTWLSNIQFEMYIWADYVFWSRVVGVGGDQDNKDLVTTDMSLVPFFDFANHSSDNSNIRWQVNQQGGIDLVTYPGEIIEKGKELLLSYGSKPNQELLFLHGFCTEDNSERSRLNIPLLPFLNPAEAPDNLLKIQWLKQNGVKPSLTLIGEENHEEDKNELIRCGWTFDSIATMYVVAMDEDNHLVLEEEEDQTTLYLSNKKMESLEKVADFVKQVHQYPIIKLKVTILLIEALEHHYAMISKDDCYMVETFLWKQAKIYRLEEKNTIKSALDKLTKIRDDLMTNPIVVEFLDDNE